MLKSRLNIAAIAGIMAVATLGMAGAPPGRSAQVTTRRRPTYTPTMVTAQDREIAAWNEAIEAKRLAKKGGKA